MLDFQIQVHSFCFEHNSSPQDCPLYSNQKKTRSAKISFLILLSNIQTGETSGNLKNKTFPSLHLTSTGCIPSSRICWYGGLYFLSVSANDSPKKSEERDVIYVGTKPIMTYVSATLTQLSTRQTVTIKARGKKITLAVDVSQMILKRMNSVGYFISDVRISSDSLTSQDGKQRNVSTMEIDLSKN